MAKESDAPQFPLTPRKANEQSQGLSHHPEFGKPSPLRPVQHQRPVQRPSHPSNPFNIPKPNQVRAEHHRAPQPRPQPQPQYPAPSQAYRPPTTPGAGVAATPRRNESFDPFKPVRPSAYNNNRFSRPADSGAFEIKRPENVTFGTPRAPKTFFTSKPSAVKVNNASKNLKNFVDLTGEGGFTPSAGSRNNVGFGSYGVDDYVDTAKANENIQALLQGAFDEDEDEKQQAKKNKKKNKNKKRKQKQRESKKKQDDSQDASQDASELDDLAAQLEGITVKEPKSTEHDEDEKKAKAIKSPAIDSDTEEASDDESESKAGRASVDTEYEDKEVVSDEEEEDEAEKEEEEEVEEEEGEEEEEEEDDGTVEGLNVKLLPHQRDGVSWMRDKELGRGKGTVPKGGILADDMGLGKTVQTIALLLTNTKPESGKVKKNYDSDDESDEEEKPRKLPPGLSKSTLVVAPLALIKQWEGEIASKVENTHKLRVCVYHGNTRAKATDNLEDYDVVITTYGTLTSEHGKGGKSGIFSVYWYRIILDEAHTIKNRNAKATQAACALDAEYRWCLSGTPMQNNLDELQSLIKFLRIKPYNDLAAWKEQIGRPIANGRGQLAIERLQIFLKAFMKRRTKDVLKLNDNLKPGEDGGEKKQKSSGFQITKREVIKVAAEFMPGEMNFYKRLEQRTENSLEKMMGDSKVDYAGALVLLLRLRQSCNHPDLVKSDLAKDKDILLQTGPSEKKSSHGKNDDLDSVADLFGALSVVTKKCDVCQTELSKEEASSGISRCGECESDLKATLGDKEMSHKKRKSKKVDAVDLTDSPSASRQAARARRNRKIVVDSDDEDEEDGDWVVPKAQRGVKNFGKAGGSDDEDAEGGGEWLGSEDEDSDSDDEGPELPTKNHTRSVTPQIQSSESESDDDIYLSAGDDEDGDKRILPSTKIRHLMKILSREAPDFKFIVFSCFTSMLDKIEPFLNRAGIGYARYDGSMRNDHREASLNKLRSNSGTRVLLCSLRAGALGLNLTAASRVVILEPFWNPVS